MEDHTIFWRVGLAGGSGSLGRWALMLIAQLHILSRLFLLALLDVSKPPNRLPAPQDGNQSLPFFCQVASCHKPPSLVRELHCCLLLGLNAIGSPQESPTVPCRHFHPESGPPEFHLSITVNPFYHRALSRMASKFTVRGGHIAVKKHLAPATSGRKG